MSEEYLWNGSGAPDPEVERLERLLRPLAHVPRPFARPARRPRRGRAIAVALLAAAVIALWLWPRRAPTGGWAATMLNGTARIGDAALARGTLGVGQWLETGVDSRAEIAVGKIGRLAIAPRTRVRLVDDGRASHRLELARGTIDAFIWAPPGQFLVETPAGLAVDLGCAYSLTVDDHGEGLLRVSSGWVGFDQGGLESFVPAGAACRTRPGRGPGTPYRPEAPLAAPLASFDFEQDPAARQQSLTQVLASATPEDAFTIWHLLARVAPADRAAVFDRLAALHPPPAGVTREGILRGDAGARDLWWSSLGLGSVEHWRRWKLQRPPAP